MRGEERAEELLRAWRTAAAAAVELGFKEHTPDAGQLLQPGLKGRVMAPPVRADQPQDLLRQAVAARSLGRPGMQRVELFRQAFGALDADSDSLITVGDLQTLLNPPWRTDPAELASMLHTFDFDGDSAVNVAEFVLATANETKSPKRSVEQRVASSRQARASLVSNNSPSQLSPVQVRAGGWFAVSPRDS
jgi:hypothetical protein